MTKLTAQDLVAREVHYCVSSLVHTLAQGYDAGIPGEPGDLADMIEQAFELASPVPDYQEAALEAGWVGPHKDKFGATYFEDETDGATYACADWRELCEAHDIEPYDREVYEHWIVSDWFADKLIEKGEKVDKDFAGMTVWARTTTGQAIYIDAVIEEIHRELMSS